MAFYECVLIARQDIATSQVEGLVAEFTKILEDNGGRVASSEYWGLRTLAYRIKKNRKAHYQMLRLEAPAAALHEMERNMRLSDDVIRYLTVRVEELEEGPSVVMQSRDRRDDRGGRGDRGDRGDRRPPREGGREGGYRGDRGPREEKPTASEGAAE
ncbi:MAG: 30S ribosomal protein S6 [Kiloniellaceae bacterium]